MTKSQKIKILLINPEQFGYHTDTYMYCQHLRKSFDIIYLCFDKGLEKMALQNVEILYLPYNTGKTKRLIHFYSFIIRLTKIEKIEVIFMIQFKFSFLIGLFAKAKVKILDYRTGDLSTNSIKRFWKNYLMWFDSLFFPHITVISKGLSQILNLNSNKTFILPLGADVISANRHNFQRMDLLYVGTLNSRNISHTIEGTAMFLARYKDIRPLFSYSIVGFGNKDEEYKIRNAIEGFELIDIIQFVGRKKYTDLPMFFESSNIGVSYLPIIPAFEYQPVTKTFEYVLSGLFTIATKTYENKQIINSQNGVLIGDTPLDFCNGLVEIMKNKEFFDSDKIRNTLSDKTWSNIVLNNLQPHIEDLIR